MTYPKKTFEEAGSIEYHVHTTIGGEYIYSSLKDARATYNEVIKGGGRAMITKISIKKIKLKSFDYVQGHL